MAKIKNTPKIKSGKLKNAKSAETRIVSEDIKALQKSFRRLKRLGLTKSKKSATVKNVQSKTVKNILAKFDDVLSGAAKAVKTTSSAAREYIGSEFRVIGNRVIVPKGNGENIWYDKKSGVIKRRRGSKDNGFYSAQIVPVKFTDLPDYFSRLIDNPELLGKLPKGGKFAFRFHGHIARNQGGYDNIEQMLGHLELYRDVWNSTREKYDRKMQEEVFHNLEIFTITPAKLKAEQRQEAANVAAGKFKRLGTDASGRTIFGTRDRHRLTQAERRARQKVYEPEKYERYLAAQKSAAKKRRDTAKLNK